MLKISFHTFGCKNNLADTGKIANGLLDIDCEILEADLNAEVHVVNTCTVTASSDSQARNLVRKIAKHNKGALIIVTGCSVRRNSNDYKELKDEVVASGNTLEVCDNLNEDVVALIKKTPSIIKTQADSDDLKLFRTRVFLQIQDGCDHFCSYCIVPFVRGEPKSRDIKEIIAEAQLLEKNQVKEVVITGINIGDYVGGIENLLEELLKSTKDIRIRLSSLRPSRITPKLIELLNEPRICPHLHISLQSASDKVLKCMNRHDYTSMDFLSITNMVHERVGHRAPFIAADVIVGHPGEEEHDFLESFRIIEASHVNKLHVFPYSPRPGTAAYSMKRPSNVETKKRKDLLLEFSEIRYKDSLEHMVGRTVNVLWETGTYGHSENYYPVKGNGVPNTITSLVFRK